LTERLRNVHNISMWITDPTNRRKSVSLTLAVASFLLVVVAGGLQMAGKITTTSIFAEVFYSSMALYFGRRLNIAGKGFTADKAEEIKEKIK